MADQPIQPCSHLKEWVSAFADGTLRGFARLYMRLHMLHCARCRAAVAALAALCNRLRSLSAQPDSPSPQALDPAKRSALFDELDRMDRRDG